MRSPIAKGWLMRCGLPRLIALSCAAGLALIAAPGQAAVIVTGYDYAPGSISGGIAVDSLGIAEYGSAGRFLSQLEDTANGDFFALYSFCVDVAHGYYTYSPYRIGPISAVTGDATKQQHLAALLTHGNAAIDAAVDDDAKSTIGAAIGIAVWEVIYESATSGYTVGAGNFSVYGDLTPDVSTLANAYLGKVESGEWTGSAARLRALISINKDLVSQNQIFLTPSGVPEPSSWALMILGIGLAGAAMRRRSVQAVLPAIA
jgi:hypothetical protein